MNTANNMTHIYYQTLFDLGLHGKKRDKNNPKEPIEITNYSFKLKNITQNIVDSKDMDYGYLCAEELWFVLANEKLSFINSFKCPGFKRTSEDGIYSNSAYGHILQKRYGFDQIEQVIEILSKKPHSRRAVINLNVPNPHRGTCFDEICTFNLSFYVEENGKLNCTCCMRSNDMIGCMPYDVAYFTNIQKYIAQRCHLYYGYYYHFAISAHHYKTLSADEVVRIFPRHIRHIVFDYNKLLELKESLYDYYLEFIDNKNQENPELNNQLLLDKFKEEKIIYIKEDKNE